MRVLVTICIAGLMGISAAIAQVPVLDQTTLTGKFSFIYGVYQRSNALVAMGTLSFDGQGHYTAVTGSVTSQGSYRVNLDGTGSLTNWFDPTLPPLSLRLTAGASLIGGSTVEQSTAYQHDLLLAIPTATKVPVMSGPWGGVSFLYTPGPPVLSRAGRFRLMFDGNGNVNSTTWTYHQSDLSNGAPQDLISTGTFSVDSGGTGTYTSAQGTKRIFVSADGNTYIGTDTSAPEMIFATRLASGNPSSTGPQGRYWWLQLTAAPPGGGNLRGSAYAWALGNGLQAFEGNGAAKANGAGFGFDAGTGRLIDLAVGIGAFTVNPDSTVALAFGGTQSPGLGVISASNTALPWTSLSAAATSIYTFNIGVQGPSFQPAGGQTVFLDPNGPMQAATHSAHPFPFAPGTLVIARGSGLATADASVGAELPLPTSLGSTSLTANGQPVGLVSIAPNAITFVMPWSTVGAGKIKLKATVGGIDSNEITVRAAPAAVGYFSTTGDGLGMIVAAHADGTPITVNSPAAAGETVVLYASGLGSLANSVAEYDWPSSANSTTVPVQVDVAGTQATVLYAGAAPGYAGVYQINVVIPTGAVTSTGANVRIFQGYAQTHPKVTIPIH